MSEHFPTTFGKDAVVDPLPLPAGAASQCVGIPVVEISTTWFAALRDHSRWKLTIHTGDGALVTRQSHRDYTSALDAAVTICRYLRWGPQTIDLAA
ncbi:hypothetical protein [Kocuria sp.]|uniref:hypothetical protein n=1 Tax=Kocuria sp. TaxID=1871328 RepID=UPI0026E010F1|nr:hypothetical protein [Kocuria sp.]MDO5619680.1 hypothetical protein [Kocuria sp.]